MYFVSGCRKKPKSSCLSPRQLTVSMEHSCCRLLEAGVKKGTNPSHRKGVFPFLINGIFLRFGDTSGTSLLSWFFNAKPAIRFLFYFSVRPWLSQSGRTSNGIRTAGAFLQLSPSCQAEDTYGCFQDNLCFAASELPVTRLVLS